MDDKTLNRDLLIGVAIIILLPVVVLIGVYKNQGFQGIKDWLVPISGYISLITISIGSWVAVNNYRLKIETEKRLSNTSLIESEVRLLTLFSEMMQVAHARYNPIESEKVVEGLFEHEIINTDDYKDITSLNFAKMKLETAILVPAYGTASQDAAIAAIYTLGKNHAILLDAAIEGLTSINSYIVEGLYPQKKKMIAGYLEELNNHKMFQIRKDK
jgi:hypothetical protein